jgi:hypothetical protein
MRRCAYRKQLDLETLVCTRGPNFPISRLESRLMCPACGNRRVTVVFEPPSNRAVSIQEDHEAFCVDAPALRTAEDVTAGLLPR